MTLTVIPSPPIRAYCTKILRFIGDEMGVTQASNIAALIERGFDFPLSEREEMILKDNPEWWSNRF
jgi:hypothetical protein